MKALLSCHCARVLGRALRSVACWRMRERKGWRSIKGKSQHLIFLFLVEFFMPVRSFALEFPGGVQVHGFATQGIFYTSNNHMFGKSDKNVSPDFTELGINGSWMIRPRLRLSLQVLSRRVGKGQDGSPQLDFGLLDYSPFETEDYRLGLRVGRVRLPYGLYNDTRDVAFTRPSVLLPQSIYLERTRNLALSADGFMSYGELRHDFGNLTAEFGAVFPRVNDRDTQLAILGRSFAGPFDGELSLIGRLGYESPEGRLRFAITAADVLTHYQARPGVPALTRSVAVDRFKPWIFSAQYRTEKWTFTSEYSLRPIKNVGFGAPYDYNIVGEAYYFQVAYQFAPKWEVMGRYDALYNDRKDPYGHELESLSQGAVVSHSQYAQDWTFGLRYDVSPSIMTRLEYHNVTGTAWLPLQDNPDTSVTKKRWDMWAFIVSFRF